MATVYNSTCTIHKTQRFDLYGQPTFDSGVVEKCAVIMLVNKSQHTTVRADSSASRGHGDEIVASAKLILIPLTKAAIGDRLVIDGIALRVISRMPVYDTLTGKITGFQVACEQWV